MKRSNLRKIHRKLYKLDKSLQSLANPEHIKVVTTDKVAWLQTMFKRLSCELTQIVDELEEELEPKDDED